MFLKVPVFSWNVPSVGTVLKELGGGVRCRNVWNFAQGLKFKAGFHSKMGVCRHELGSTALRLLLRRKPAETTCTQVRNSHQMPLDGSEGFHAVYVYGKYFKKFCGGVSTILVTLKSDNSHERIQEKPKLTVIAICMDTVQSVTSNFPQWRNNPCLRA